MDRYQFITVRGRRILHINLAGIKADEAAAAIETGKKMVSQEPKGSVLTLTDITQGQFNVTVIRALQGFTQFNRPYVRAAAVIGVDGLRRIALETVEKFSGRNFAVFATRAEAENWLSLQ
ncbi:MAG: hypothetical protein KA764_08530 [Anaerolineales bacterium]|nr:hypothetical protein [Anaerolineales bacterium]